MNKKTIWALIFMVVVSVIIYSDFAKVGDREKIHDDSTAPSSNEGRGRIERDNVDKPQEPGKYDDLLDDIKFTQEEKEARPEDASDTSWRATVFFHRQNIRDQNGEVQFYGKVIDQNGEVVSGAKVSALSEYYVESIKEQLDFGGGKKGTKKIEARTDENGLFVIDGYRATNLSFKEISKAGYKAKEKLPAGFVFANTFSRRYEADPTEPMIFHMWKMGATEPLKKSRWRKSVIPDGTAYVLDLETGVSLREET